MVRSIYIDIQRNNGTKKNRSATCSPKPDCRELARERLCLKEKGFELIVATSKPEQYSVQILDHFDLSKYFDFICGSNMDESRSKKEEVIEYALGLANNKNKETILMIGDREYDIIGAQKNNIKSCGVLFGYGSKEEHQNAGADFICDSVKDLQDLLLG